MLSGRAGSPQPLASNILRTAPIVTNHYGALITDRSKMMVNAAIAIATMLACRTTIVNAQISGVQPQSHITYASRMLKA